MPATLPQDDHTLVGSVRGNRARIWTWFPVAVMVAIAAAFHTSGLPFALVLPAIAIVAVVVGFALGFYGWLAGASSVAVHENRKTLAALLILIGFAASILADVPDALRALAELEASHVPR